MKKLALLIAAGSLWLFLAAIPALADGGPHVSSVNSGTSSLTADSCAGCHRAHSAQGEYLLAQASEEALCLSCHGTSSTLATTDVENGIQYVPSGTTRSGSVLGALRDGGFLNARIGASSPTRASYVRGYEDGPYNTVEAISTRPKVGVGGSAAVTSAHIDLGAPTAGVADTGRAWGSGAAGVGQANVGQANVTLECVSCHNPHGNGQYRILKPTPGIEASILGGPVTLSVKATYTNNDYIVTTTQHGLVANDYIYLNNVGGLTGNYYVYSVVNGFTFSVISLPADTTVANLTDTTSTGTLYRASNGVTDYPVDPENDQTYPTKNYTILQVKGAQGVNSSFMLYARDVVAAQGGSGLAADGSPVTVTAIVVVSSTSYLQTGTSASGVAAGDLVAISGVTGVTDGTYTVGSLRSSGSTLYNQFSLVGQTPAAATFTGSVTRKGITGTYTNTSGDYFRRTVPWNPAIQNPSCQLTVYSTTNSAYCATMNDAPNGIPASIQNSSTGGRPSGLYGQQAFTDQMSTWCASCHTRYYSATNENTGSEAVISALDNIGIGQLTTAGRISSSTYSTGSQFGTPSFGDRVTFAGTGLGLDTNPAGGWYVVATGTGYFSVAATLSGTPYTTGFTNTTATWPTTLGTYTKVYQSSASSWGYPRNTLGTADTTYKYQHSTASNRACTVCHVGHGSNAVMSGADSLAEAYPDGTTTSTSSRLLKVNNRGTCQMCHDPTGTVAKGTTIGSATTIP